MSASWWREPGRAPARPVLLLATVLVVAAGFAAESRAQRSRSLADSGETVRRITVSPRGIVIERAGEADTVIEERTRDRVRARIRERVRGGLIEIDEGGTGIVRILSDASVPRGVVVDGNVVAVLGSVEVAGEVTGDVVAVLGSVRLEPGAHVHGDAVSVGGGLEHPEGATIEGESVSLGFAPLTWGLPALPVMLISIAAGWLVSMFVGWIFLLLFPTGLLRVATVAERRPAASFFLGVVSVPLFFVVLALLFVTVIGIPLGILLPMLYALMGYAGQLAATCVLGARLTRRSLAGGLITPLAVGTAFVAVLLVVGAAMSVTSGMGHPLALLFTLTGTLLLLGLGALGTGAFILSRFGTRPAEVVWTGHTATGPIPAAAPTSVAG